MQRFHTDDARELQPGLRIDLADGRRAQVVMSSAAEGGGQELLAVTQGFHGLPEQAASDESGLRTGACSRRQRGAAGTALFTARLITATAAQVDALDIPLVDCLAEKARAYAQESLHAVSDQEMGASGTHRLRACTGPRPAAHASAAAVVAAESTMRNLGADDGADGCCQRRKVRAAQHQHVGRPCPRHQTTGPGSDVQWILQPHRSPIPLRPAPRTSVAATAVTWAAGLSRWIASWYASPRTVPSVAITAMRPVRLAAHCRGCAGLDDAQQRQLRERH